MFLPAASHSYISYLDRLFSLPYPKLNVYKQTVKNLSHRSPAYYTHDILLFHVTSQIVSFSPHRFAVMRRQLTHHIAPSGAVLYNSYKKMTK
jgi:hypothetical protein